LLDRLTSKETRTIPEDLKEHLIQYYAVAAKQAETQQSIDEKLDILKRMKAIDPDHRSLPAGVKPE
jgi:hypothetical protein